MYLICPKSHPYYNLKCWVALIVLQWGGSESVRLIIEAGGGEGGG